MQQYGIFKAIVLSFFSGDLYRDVAQNWGGKAFLYLLVLLAITWIPACFVAQKGTTVAYDKFSASVVNQVPVLDIKEGKISTPENRPYVVKDEKGEVLAVIDTSGQYKTLQDSNSKVLVTEKEVIMESKPNEIKTYTIPADTAVTLDPVKVNETIKSFLPFLWLILYPILVIFSFVYRIIQALIYGVFGKIFSAATGAYLSYGQTIQLSMVAITPVVIISTIAEVTGTIWPFEGLTFFALAMAYLFFAVYANRKPTAPAAVQPVNPIS